MIRPWNDHEGLRCIVLCAGGGSRMSPITAELPKVLSPVNDKPVLHYVIDHWKQFTDDFVFIVGYKKEMVIDYVLGETVRAEFIEQRERKGIAHAIMQAEKAVGDKFIVVLGDCVCKGSFTFADWMDQGIGIFTTDQEADIRQSYSVEMQGGLVSRVVEKPRDVVNNLCGMGFYFFRRKLFDYIRITPPSVLRNEVEITDSIQKMIDAGEPVSPVWFRGEYLNVTFSGDIENAKRIISGRARRNNDSTL